MHQESGLLVLIFVIAALLIGAASRYFLRHLRLPYTVILLLIGLAIGYLPRFYDLEAGAPGLSNMLNMVANIDPHLILFLFLPTLIFESAFAMEVHLFKRMLSQILTLAVPGMLLCTFATAALSLYLVPWEWSWIIALMFGALISATDPVAVVALLKEVSSRKRLETLIEGESLINDGTAIVVFTLFYSLAVSSEQSTIGIGVIGTFLWVVALGVIIGATCAWISLYWIGRVFNDALVETAVSIAMAYIAFIVAEHTFHVSGVVAVVTLALIYASNGRTRFSPEVAEFLHHFWETMAYMANTLIFLIVGIVIAQKVHIASAQAWWALLWLYIGIIVIRGTVVTLLMPALKRLGIGINRAKATVLVWGGLRGAVSLALALSLAQDSMINSEQGQQILFLAAGIVVLTILVNGSTMEGLLGWFGLNELPPAKAATVDKAKNIINRQLASLLPRLSRNEFLKGADWRSIQRTVWLETSDNHSLESCESENLKIAFYRRLLEAERKHYWQQYKSGALGGQAAQILVEAVEHALDGEPELTPRNDLQRYWQANVFLKTFWKYKLTRKIAAQLAFSRMALGYDIARGFINAQEDTANHIEALAPDTETAYEANADMLNNRRATFCVIEQLRDSFPELVNTLETQAATRILLNRERSIIQQLLADAVLDKPEADSMIQSVEARMCSLRKQSVNFIEPDPIAVMRASSWASGLALEEMQELLSLTQMQIYSERDSVISANTQPSIGIVLRGAVEILDTHHDDAVLLNMLGIGSVIANLKEEDLDYQVNAVAPTQVLWISEQENVSDKLVQRLIHEAQQAKVINQNSLQ